MLTPPREQPLGALPVSLSVQDSWGIVYTVPAGDLPADGRYHHLTAALSATRGARYPLRLLALSVSYELPGFPPPPYPGNAAKLAALRAEHQRAAARAALVIRALAVSTSASGGFPAPFAGPGRWPAGIPRSRPRTSPTRTRTESPPPSPPGGPRPVGPP